MSANKAKQFREFLASYRVTCGKDFHLQDYDPGDTQGLGSEQKKKAREQLTRGVEWLAEQQERL